MKLLITRPSSGSMQGPTVQSSSCEIAKNFLGQNFVDLIYKWRNKTVREAATFDYQAFFNVELEVNERPSEFVLETVAEVGSLTEAPLPVR